MPSPGRKRKGRAAFQDGTLIFHRNWPYVYALASKDDGSSKIKGKFAVAPLPGFGAPGISSLGGHNFAIAKNAKNKGTAAEFLKFTASEEEQKSNTIATSAAPSFRGSLHRCGARQEVPATCQMPAEVDRDRPATADGREVR